jgi:hypothetical protein
LVSVGRIIREGGQPATTAFRVLSATPNADLSGHGAPALLVDPDTRSLPWKTLPASQAIPLRCAELYPHRGRRCRAAMAP